MEQDRTIIEVGEKMNKQLKELEEGCKILREGKISDRIFDDEGNIDLHLEEWENIVTKTCPDVIHMLDIMITSFTGSGIFIVLYIILVEFCVCCLAGQVDKRKQTLVLLDTIMSMKSSGQTHSSPLTDGRSVSLKLNQTSNTTIDNLSKERLSHSSSSSRNIKTELEKHHSIKYSNLLQVVREKPNNIVGVQISDNYNPHQVRY